MRGGPHNSGVIRFPLASVLLLTWFLAVPAFGAESPVARDEIAHLLDHLEHSACRFYRNGSWYDAAEARAHLDKKYAYLRRKDLVRTAEDFIERAASGSSMSGKPYQVQCAGGESIPSARWLTEELRRYRKSRRAQE